MGDTPRKHRSWLQRRPPNWRAVSWRLNYFSMHSCLWLRTP